MPSLDIVKILLWITPIIPILFKVYLCVECRNEIMQVFVVLIILVKILIFIYIGLVLGVFSF